LTVEVDNVDHKLRYLAIWTVEVQEDGPIYGFVSTG
jgi:hypothetical protein